MTAGSQGSSEVLEPKGEWTIRSELPNGIASSSESVGVNIQQQNPRLIDDVADVMAGSVGWR